MFFIYTRLYPPPFLKSSVYIYMSPINYEIDGPILIYFLEQCSTVSEWSMHRFVEVESKTRGPEKNPQLILIRTMK